MTFKNTATKAPIDFKLQTKISLLTCKVQIWLNVNVRTPMVKEIWLAQRSIDCTSMEISWAKVV